MGSNANDGADKGEKSKIDAAKKAEELEQMSNVKQPDDNDGYVTYGELDSLGRPTGIEAVITKNMIGKGTKANSSIKPPGFGGGGAGSPGHARGHLLAKQLGGSGNEKKNLVTLYQNDTNSPLMRDFETAVRKAVDNGETVHYKVTPVYEGDNPIPVAVTLEAVGSNGFSLHVSIPNKKRVGPKKKKKKYKERKQKNV